MACWHHRNSQHRVGYQTAHTQSTYLTYVHILIHLSKCTRIYTPNLITENPVLLVLSYILIRFFRSVIQMHRLFRLKDFPISYDSYLPNYACKFTLNSVVLAAQEMDYRPPLSSFSFAVSSFYVYPIIPILPRMTNYKRDARIRFGYGLNSFTRHFYCSWILVMPDVFHRCSMSYSIFVLYELRYNHR